MIKSIVFDFNGVILDSSTHRINEDMMELLKDLFETNFKLHLFSNTSKQAINILNAKYDFLKYFHNVILVEDTGLSKPSDASFENLLKIVGDMGEEMVLIDDGKDNLRQAKRFGMVAIPFVDADRLRISLSALDI
ncbi:HAD hydrolase-like protein [Patescibacteria group bacterium]|nr:HAD hydrolase-like protein [Patescibacteria group bacterium]